MEVPAYYLHPQHYVRIKQILGDALVAEPTNLVHDLTLVKSPAELALMRKAAEVTLAAYRHTWPLIEKGMTPADISKIMNDATARLGGSPEFALVLLGEASAYPHGSGKPQAVREGEIVLTSLVNRAQPVVRYKTGDLGSITESACACGSRAPIVSAQNISPPR